MTFPLISIPKRIVYVDDKGSFLETLRKTMPKNHARQFISTPSGAISRLAQEIVYWRELEQLLSVSENAGDDAFGFAARLVKSYFGNWSRFHLTSVLIVDYSMPGLNGLEMIRRLGSWPGRKILLTGEADVSIAIAAFNEGLIQKFIPKDTKHLYNALRAGYEEMHVVVCEHIGQLIRPLLSAWQKDLLQDPRVASALQQKIKDLDWAEYVVVAKPFGLLGMSHEGPLQWLQLETAETLASLSELIGEQGYPASEVLHVKNGHVIGNNELHVALNLEGDVCLNDADMILDGPSLYCAVFDLPIEAVSSKGYGIDDISTPLDEMRALIRDLEASFRLQGAYVAGLPEATAPAMVGNAEASKASASNNSQPLVSYGDSGSSFESALSRLRLCAGQSSMHRHALELVLKERSLPSELSAYVESTAAIAKATVA